MVNDNTTCFQVRDIDSNKWNELSNNIDRKVFNKQKKEWTSRSLEDYFRELIYKLSKLPKEEINLIVEPESKIEVKR